MSSVEENLAKLAPTWEERYNFLLKYKPKAYKKRENLLVAKTVLSWSFAVLVQTDAEYTEPIRAVGTVTILEKDISDYRTMSKLRQWRESRSLSARTERAVDIARRNYADAYNTSEHVAGYSKRRNTLSEPSPASPLPRAFTAASAPNASPVQLSEDKSKVANPMTTSPPQHPGTPQNPAATPIIPKEVYMAQEYCKQHNIPNDLTEDGHLRMHLTKEMYKNDDTETFSRHVLQIIHIVQARSTEGANGGQEDPSECEDTVQDYVNTVKQQALDKMSPDMLTSPSSSVRGLPPFSTVPVSISIYNKGITIYANNSKFDTPSFQSGSNNQGSSKDVHNIAGSSVADPDAMDTS